jgi:hypothetical protein
MKWADLGARGTLLVSTSVLLMACGSSAGGSPRGSEDSGAGGSTATGGSGASGAAGAVNGGAGNSGGAPNVGGAANSGGTGNAGAGNTGGVGNAGNGKPGSGLTTCAAVVTAVDTQKPDHVVGSGSSASCTEAALATAVTAGGIITFDCGGPATIAVTHEMALPTDVATTLDGGGNIILDGGGATRILKFDHGDFRKNTTVVTLQRITLRNGKSTGTPIPAAPAPCSQGTQVDGGGSAVYVRDGVVHLIDATFANNQAPDTGPDVGGAVYVLGSLGVLVEGSAFADNTGSNGGALYMLNSDLSVSNSTFTGNKALGTGENYIDAKCAVNGGESGNGGNAAAIAIDGGSDGDDLFCGDVFSGNTGNELGTIGRTPDGAKMTTTFDRCTFDGNQTNGGGALYFHNSKLVITASTFSNNTAKGSGAIQADGTDLDFTNVTFAGNSASGGLGGAIALFGNGGSLVNCTFADNKAEGGSGLFGAAIAGNPTLTIQNTIFSQNTSKDCGAPMACQDGSSTGDGNLQWPDKHTVCTGADPKCTPTTTYADAALGVLTDNGGPTKTEMPASTSPALGVGTNCPPTDQRGHARPSNGCAAGAVEPP